MEAVPQDGRPAKIVAFVPDWVEGVPNDAGAEYLFLPKTTTNKFIFQSVHVTTRNKQSATTSGRRGRGRTDLETCHVSSAMYLDHDNLFSVEKL